MIVSDIFGIIKPTNRCLFISLSHNSKTKLSPHSGRILLWRTSFRILSDFESSLKLMAMEGALRIEHPLHKVHRTILTCIEY